MSKDPALAELQDRIGHRFKDRELLIRALTHSSFGDGAGDTGCQNPRTTEGS